MPRPRIGLLSPFWLPLWGGAEQYHYRLATNLQADGFDVRVLTGTAARPDRDNGAFPAERYVEHGDFRLAEVNTDRGAYMAERFGIRARHHAYVEEALHWCTANGIRLVIMGNPLQWVQLPYFRELYRRLNDRGVQIGVVFHDLPEAVEKALQQAYLGNGFDWDAAALTVTERLATLARTLLKLEWSAMIGSPLFFEPDFIICNSEWSSRFIDPLNEVPKLVLHPPIDVDHWASPVSGATRLPPADLLMINPQPKKGRLVMRNLIEDLGADRTFRLLKGGWGDSFRYFRPVVAHLPAFMAGKVEMIDYVADIRSAYQSAGVLIFPSIFEGYGMTPVEAMSGGTPVVSSSYPAVLEAVGDGALTLCPVRHSRAEWKEAVRKVLADRRTWADRALQRSRALQARAKKERQALNAFLDAW